MSLDLNAPDLAVIALGGNLRGAYPSMAAALAAAAGKLSAAGFEVLAVSRWWGSAAWPDPTDPPFLNGVVLARTALEPEAALRALHGVEAAFGRGQLSGRRRQGRGHRRIGSRQAAAEGHPG